MPRTSRKAKAANHERIVEAASRQFRKRGIEATGVADVMAAAGMTHGGFYRHFTSKTSLAVEAIERAFDESIARLDAALASAKGKAGVLKYAAQYLSDDHIDDQASGCPIVPLAAEAARHQDGERAAFDNGISRMIARLASAIGGPEEIAKGTAMTLLAHLAGSVSLLRVIQSDDLTSLARRRAIAHVKLILNS